MAPNPKGNHTSGRRHDDPERSWRPHFPRRCVSRLSKPGEFRIDINMGSPADHTRESLRRFHDVQKIVFETALPISKHTIGGRSTLMLQSAYATLGSCDYSCSPRPAWTVGSVSPLTIPAATYPKSTDHGASSPTGECSLEKANVRFWPRFGALGTT